MSLKRHIEFCLKHGLNYVRNSVSKHKFYAEDGLDRHLRRVVFHNYNRLGVMVEVGGGHPKLLSMSRHWKESGWRTIVVEPNPRYADMHRKAGNEVVQCAAGACEGSAEFTAVTRRWPLGDMSYSGFGNDAPSHMKQTKFTVRVRRLDDILDELEVRHVDLISVDVEGFELEVLSGFTPSRFGFPVLVLEANKAMQERLTELGYVRTASFDAGLNTKNEIYEKRPERISADDWLRRHCVPADSGGCGQPAGVGSE